MILVKKVLVTGGAGFIGSHIVDLLVSQGYSVTIVDNFSSGVPEYTNDNVNIYNVDIISDELNQVFEICNPDYVIHTAAQISVATSQAEPYFDAHVNILGTVNVLEMCRKFNVRKLVYTSSAAVYGDADAFPIEETFETLPISQYGLSKLVGEKYIQTYHRLYGLPYTILRFSNVYGTRQKLNEHSGVIPLFINRMIRDKEIYIYGDGSYTRDFIYVKDVAQAVLVTLESPLSEVYNISSGEEVSVNELVRLLGIVMETSPKVNYSASKEGDIKKSLLSHSKISSNLSWRPKVSLFEGLYETFEYYFQLYERKEGILKK